MSTMTSPILWLLFVLFYTPLCISFPFFVLQYIRYYFCIKSGRNACALLNKCYKASVKLNLRPRTSLETKTLLHTHTHTPCVQLKLQLFLAKKKSNVFWVNAVTQTKLNSLNESEHIQKVFVCSTCSLSYLSHTHTGTAFRIPPTGGKLGGSNWHQHDCRRLFSSGSILLTQHPSRTTLVEQILSRSHWDSVGHSCRCSL